MENQPSFSGLRNDPLMYQGSESTVSAVKSEFLKLTHAAGSVVVNGLSGESIESALRNVVAPLNDETANDYDRHDNRRYYLANNYDPVTQEVDGIGILTMKTHLKVWDYNHKHNWELTISAWSALYNDVADLQADSYPIK